jgi:thiol-disulfide isomerase/thioredoxin
MTPQQSLGNRWAGMGWRARRWGVAVAILGLAALAGLAGRGRPTATAAERADRTQPAGDDAVRVGPRVLSPRDAAVGHRLSDLTLKTVDDKPIRLGDFREARGVVLFMTGTGCPLARKYLPVMAELQKRYAAQGVAFIAINAQATETPEQIREAVAAAGYAGMMTRDPEQQAAAALGVSTTTETVLIDSARTVAYRGAADDQFGIGYALPVARRQFLADAIDAILAGRTPAVAATTAPGCAMEPAARAKPLADGSASPGVTYHNRISRIIQRSCLECHRAGENGPFELGSYALVKEHLPMIRRVVQNGTMPPWHAVGGTWSNDWSLPERDKADLLAWASAGAPEGDPADAPRARAFVQGWRIGTPDAVFVAGKAQDIPAKGPIPYRYVAIETNLKEDRWVTAAEIRVDQPEVVHHLLAFVQFPKGDPRAKNYPDVRGGAGGYFAGLVPGQAATEYPAGTAKLLPRGANLILQIHYTPNGKAVVDRPRIGFRFAAAPPKHEMLTVAAHTERFRIPPGAANHEVTADYPFNGPARLYAFSPHSHVRGKAWRYELIHADGRRQVVLDVPRYDFNWQLEYRLAEPIDVAAGAVLRATAWYDNSAANPANPDPTATVRFGEQTDQEMMIGYITGHRL